MKNSETLLRAAAAIRFDVGHVEAPDAWLVAVADWLEDVAKVSTGPWARGALTVARAYLGESDA